MSCCPGPERGKPFDPDAEMPCATDMARFGGDDEDDMYDDHAYDARDPNRFGEGKGERNAMVAKVLIGAIVLAAAGGLLAMQL
jgi:hypothetical protein